jgi:hypothetical protein
MWKLKLTVILHLVMIQSIPISNKTIKDLVILTLKKKLKLLQLRSKLQFSEEEDSQNY